MVPCIGEEPPEESEVAAEKLRDNDGAPSEGWGTIRGEFEGATREGMDRPQLCTCGGHEIVGSKRRSAQAALRSRVSSKSCRINGQKAAAAMQAITRLYPGIGHRARFREHQGSEATG